VSSHDEAEFMRNKIKMRREKEHALNLAE